MKICVKFLTLLAAVSLAGAAHSATYIVSVEAKVGRGSSVDRFFNPVTNSSTLKTGDKFSLSYQFDTTASSVTSLFDSDPTINIYYGQASNLKLMVGDYTLNAGDGKTSFLSTQLWNNYSSGTMNPTDSFSQSVVYRLTDASPVELGLGQINFVSSLNAFDFTALARNSDSITEIPPLSAYTTTVGSFGFINDVTLLQTSYTLDGVTASIREVGAVPEPTTWMLMMLGMAGVGFSMRRKDKQTLRANFS